MTERYAPTRRHVLAMGAGAAFALGTEPLHAQGAPELRIGTGFGLSFFPVRLAEMKGFYAKHAKAVGIPDMKVSLASFSGNSAMNDGILSGSIDLCIAAVPGLLLLWEKTRGPDKVVGYSGLSNLPGVLLAVDPKLKSLRDLGRSTRSRHRRCWASTRSSFAWRPRRSLATIASSTTTW